MLAKQNYLQKKDLNMYSATPTHLYRKTKVLLKVTITKHCKPLTSRMTPMKRIGFRERDWFRGFTPTLKGFLSSSFKWVCTDNLKSSSTSKRWLIKRKN